MLQKDRVEESILFLSTIIKMIFGLKQFTDGDDRGWVAVNPQGQKYKLTNDDGTNFSKGYTTINLNNEDEIKRYLQGYVI